jgi:hypothetical protein
MKIFGDVNVSSGGEFNTTPETVAISGNGLTINAATGNIFYVNQNANITSISISNQQDGQHVFLVLKQSANGWTVTWPSNFTFIGPSAIDASSGQINLLHIVWLATLSSWIAVLETNNSAGSGTVTSVGLSDASTYPVYTVSGTPVTSSGVLSLVLATQSANKIFAGPVAGGAAQPNFRSLVFNDIPSLNTYEEQTATSGQTVFNTTIVTTTANSGSYTHLAVFVNGVFQVQGSTKAYQVTGANQITFNYALSLNSDVVFIGST